MCWIGTIEYKRVATEDVTVFKILYLDTFGNYNAPYHYTSYHIGELKEVVSLGIRKRGFADYRIHIEEGLHAYSMNCQIIRRPFITYIEKNGKCIQYYNYLKRGKLKLIKCVIPKGTEYWENKFGEIVTTKIKPIEEIKII